ncbi:MAG: hypothetical protein CMC52_01515 [Flavobacteriaceae bacterium]|nr:hypothetical protein [Flavobacteriaceae bacterium]
MSGFILVASATVDPILHDHFDEESSEVACQFYSNELISLSTSLLMDNEAFVDNVFNTRKRIILLPQDLKNFQSRAPPVI